MGRGQQYSSNANPSGGGKQMAFKNAYKGFNRPEFYYESEFYSYCSVKPFAKAASRRFQNEAPIDFVKEQTGEEDQLDQENMKQWHRRGMQ